MFIPGVPNNTSVLSPSYLVVAKVLQRGETFPCGPRGCNWSHALRIREFQTLLDLSSTWRKVMWLRTGVGQQHRTLQLQGRERFWLETYPQFLLIRSHLGLLTLRAAEEQITVKLWPLRLFWSFLINSLTQFQEALQRFASTLGIFQKEKNPLVDVPLCLQSLKSVLNVVLLTHADMEREGTWHFL